MSINEFMLWQKFRNKRGSLHLGMRFEQQLAQWQAMWFNSKTPKDAPVKHTEDFAPHMDERIVSALELAQQMGST